MTVQTILLVEDEKDIRELLALTCKREGFAVLETENGAKALTLAREKKPDAIVLDLMLPGLDGLSVCKALQRDPDTAAIPVIMLTARGEEIDRIVGFEVGASDYVVKPFSTREVMLRIKSVLKRTSLVPEQTALASGAIRLDALRHVVFVGDEEVLLTVTEFRLLEDLLRHAGQVRSREQVLDAVWGYSFEGYARTVDTHIRRLRAKLGPGADVIETVRGIGYRIKG
ncbi:MAG: response regulator [Desulfovibrionales bacterium]|nr:response regulator [Desulfovibrionales bacterium]